MLFWFVLSYCLYEVQKDDWSTQSYHYGLRPGLSCINYLGFYWLGTKMDRHVILVLVMIYILTIGFVARSAFVIGRDGVVAEAMRYIYDECKKWKFLLIFQIILKNN